MIAWIVMKTGLSSLAVKLILSAVVLSGIFLSLRWYGNRQYYQGETAGRQNVAKELEKQFLEREATAKAAIFADAAVVADEKRAVEAAAEQLAKDRVTIARSLKDSLASIRAGKDRDYENRVVSVPPAELDSALRSVSAELAAIK